MPGQRASNSSITLPTVEARNSRRRTAPGNKCHEGSWKRHYDFGNSREHSSSGMLIASPNRLSLDDHRLDGRIAGRCCAMQLQLSPSSALANNEPVFVPK